MIHNLALIVTQMTGLQTLLASSCKIKSIAPEVGALVALVTLDVSSNDLKQLQDQLGQLPY